MGGLTDPSIHLGKAIKFDNTAHLNSIVFEIASKLCQFTHEDLRYIERRLRIALDCKPSNRKSFMEFTAKEVADIYYEGPPNSFDNTIPPWCHKMAQAINKRLTQDHIVY